MRNTTIADIEMYQIETKDGLVVCTPPNTQTMTSAVLLEQEKWVEPELDFVLDYLQPGMNVVDGGAAFGVFALPMAQKVGKEGAVYAFEPCADTKQYLERSKDENDLEQLNILGRALGEQASQGKLRWAQTPENNELDANGDEKISITTLDAWWNYARTPAVDLLKLDINGMEANALRGASTLIAQEKPLVLAAIAANDTAKEDPREQLSKMGYQLFEYVRGPGLLVEHDSGSGPDPYLMNYVGIPENRVDEFRQAGWIFDEGVSFAPPETETWKEVLGSLRWSKDKIAEWEKLVSSGEHAEYLEALNLLCSARQVSTDITKNPLARSRKGSMILEAAQHLVEIFNNGKGNIAAAMSYIRSMYELGRRSQALDMAKELMDTVNADGVPKQVFPFLPPLPWQDDTEVKTDFGKWLSVRAVEAWIALKDGSVYTSGEQEKKLLEALAGNPETASQIVKKSYFIGNGQKQTLTKDKVVRNHWFWNSKQATVSVNGESENAGRKLSGVLSHIYLAIPGTKGGAHGIHKARAKKMADEIQRQGIDASIVSGNSPEFVKKIVEASNKSGHVFYTGVFSYDLSVHSQLGITGNLFELMDVPVFGLLGDHPYTEFMWHRMEQAGSTTFITPLPSVKEEYETIFGAQNSVEVSAQPAPPSTKSGWQGCDTPFEERPIDILIPWGIHKFLNDQRSLDEKLRPFGKAVLNIGRKVYHQGLHEYECSLLTVFQEVYAKTYGGEYKFSKPITKEGKRWLKMLSIVDWSIRKERRLEMLKMLPAVPSNYKVVITAHPKVGQVLPFLDNGSNIEWVNEVSIDRLNQLYGQSKIVLNCNPTYPDTLHARVRSGMAHGCYVISDYNPLLEEALGDNVIGFIGKHSKALAEQVVQSWEDLQEKADRGRKIAEENFTVERQAQRLIEIIDQHVS